MSLITKKKIEVIVADYIKKFPEEFALVKEAIDGKKKLNREEFAMLEGSTETRALFEISETLQTMLILGLDEGDTEWWKTKAGGQWFAKKFPVFALPDSI